MYPAVQLQVFPTQICVPYGDRFAAVQTQVTCEFASAGARRKIAQGENAVYQLEVRMHRPKRFQQIAAQVQLIKIKQYVRVHHPQGR